MSMIPINNPINHGWKEEDGKLLPIWTTLSFAKDVFYLNVKCTYPYCLLAVQTREDKVEVYTSGQVHMHMREVGGLEQFPILT